MARRMYVLVLLIWLTAAAVFAQTPATGTLRVTVVDPSSAVVVGAKVTVTGTEEPASRAAIAPAVTTDAGIATIPNLAPGRYTVQAEFPGFETRVLNDVRVRAGDNKQVAVLQIPKLEASVTVGQSRQEAASDPRMSFGTTLTREQIEALSDDPVTLQQQLQEMAGPGAVMRVDGFEGSPLPAKAQIRSIRISRDQFAAEYHTAGGVSIEIITQPGLGPVRYNMNTGVRSGRQRWCAYGVGGPSIGETLGVLEDRHERQAPMREDGLAIGPEERCIGELEWS